VKGGGEIKPPSIGGIPDYPLGMAGDTKKWKRFLEGKEKKEISRLKSSAIKTKTEKTNGWLTMDLKKKITTPA